MTKVYVIPDLIQDLFSVIPGPDPGSIYILIYTEFMPRFRYGFVYMMASKKNGTIYIGVTTNLLKRTYQHKNHEIEGFTDQYNVDKLVYFETYDDLKQAIQREKQLKNWKRDWKIQLIEKDNPDWIDLYNKLV